MKTVIQENAGYAMYAEVDLIEMSKDNEYVLKFSTTYDQSRDPKNERIVAQFILRRSELILLRDVIKMELDSPHS